MFWPSSIASEGGTAVLRKITIIIALGSVFVRAAGAEAQAVLPPDVLAAGLQQAECETTPEDATASMQSFDLDGTSKLVKVACWLAAYNEGSILFVVDPAQPATAKLQQFMEWDTSANTWTPSFVLVGVAYEVGSKQIRTFNRFRGISDCGSTGVWTWSGAAFTMTGYWVKRDCDETPFDPATQPQWQIFPSG
jgi:hypothetical protein